MLDVLSQGFQRATERLHGKARLTAENVEESLQDIRHSLLEADVEYGVAKLFLARVKEKALGQEVSLKAGKGRDKVRVSPGDHFVKTCKEELEALMGPVETKLNLSSGTPSSIMMVGLQGTGKTTTTGKLAKYLREQQKKKPLLVACDIYRPAAVDQLKTLGQRLNIPTFHAAGKTVPEICRLAKNHALEIGCDVLLLDTAGRLTIDADLMQELADVKSVMKPSEILLVCDAMMGQDAVTTAKAFNEQLELSGFIMTKLDGDARGGAALSIKEVTGKPIKFLGMGEDLARLEVFRPEGLSSRILGMGDVVGLMEDFEKVADDDAEADAMRMLSGGFTFKDFYKQISMIQKMGSLKDVMAKMPMQNMLPAGADVDEGEFVRIKSLIDSMTEKERVKPSLIDASRAARIARGSGRQVSDVSELIKKFKAMRKMMGGMSKSLGLMSKIPGLNKLGLGGGGMPSMEQMQSMMPPGMGGGAPAAAGMPKRVDRDKLKKTRKAQKANRKRNRKR